MDRSESRQISRRSLLSLMAIGSAGALLAACQGAAPAPAPTAAPAPKPTEAPAAAAAPTTAPAAKSAATLKPFSLRQNWYIGGLHAPFYLGKERGYYAEQGID